MQDSPQVIHTNHEDKLVLTEPYVYVGLISMSYGPIRDFRKHAEFMRDFEPEYITDLKGLDLVCDCSQKENCHALILLELANPFMTKQLELDLF